MNESLINSIHFEKVNRHHQQIIFSWLAEPHMQEFWDNSQEHKDDIVNFINGRVFPSTYFGGVFTYWVGVVNNDPFCFILTSEVKPDDKCEPVWEEYISKTGKTYSIDFGIGNSKYLGKGLAAATLKKFTTFFQQEIDPLADTFFIDPDENNPRAKHVYEKAGFNLVCNYDVQYGEFKGKVSHLMVKKLLPMSSIKPFSISIDEAILADLRARIHNTRWPDQIPGIEWEQGTELNYLKELLAYWATEFDWRAAEKHLNTFNHFIADIDGTHIHFIHAKAHKGNGIPLILTHGWPSTFMEMLPLIPFLTDPTAHGINGPAFDLVIPSLPGYGFSERPARTGVNYRYVANLWHQLMQKLGYKKYGAHGTDFGSGTATLLALDYPDSVLGIHLSTLDIAPYMGKDSSPLSLEEQNYLAINNQWASKERGYSAIQSTKPQTLGYALNDSPAGLAAWIIEKWRSWSDSHGDINAHVSLDFLLSTLTIYWATQTITSSMRDYYDNRWMEVTLTADDKVRIPTGIAMFNHEFVPEGRPPQQWAERLYANIQRWTVMPRGGHFAAVEEPLLLAQDIAAFFAQIKSR